MNSSLGEQGYAQLEVAKAETLPQSSRSFLFHAIQDFWGTQENGMTPTMRQRALARMAGWNVGHVGKTVADMMFATAGSHAVRESQPFGMYLRDAQAVAQHRAFAANNIQVAGRVLMGLDPGTSRF